MPPPEIQQLFQLAVAKGLEFTQTLGEPTDLSEKSYLDFVANQEKSLAESWYKNKFFLTFNLKKNNVGHCGGLNDVMGWSDEISVETFFQKVHPDYLSPWLHWSLAIYEVAEALKDRIKPVHQSFQYQLPMQHGNGRYFWCSSKVVALRLDAKNNMVVHGNIFERREELTPFNYQLFEPFLIEQLHFMDEWNVRLRQKMKTYVLNPLNNNELGVIRHSLSGLKTEQIAAEMGISKNTVMAYKKNILRRGHSIGGKVFRDADEVGRYFKTMGWVE